MSKESIDVIRQQIDAAWLRSDADGITSGLAEDAVLLPPHSPRQVGRQQINSWLKEFFRHYRMTELAMPERELTISGSLAFERGLYEWSLAPLGGGEVVRNQANWVGIWRKDADGTWAEVCGIWNSVLPVDGARSREAVAEGASAGSR
jgi:uncharacterized protein (TIGR02246 family)